MDIFRKELNAFYESQRLAEERLDYTVLDECKIQMGMIVGVDQSCRIITDAAHDYCYIWGGNFTKLVGLSESSDYFTEMESSDEDEIYNQIHPEDLVDKRMLEYDFFKFVDLLPAESKPDFKAHCHMRIKDNTGKYIYIDNTTQVLRLSPNDKIWLILCTYDLLIR